MNAEKSLTCGIITDDDHADYSSFVEKWFSDSSALAHPLQPVDVSIPGFCKNKTFLIIVLKQTTNIFIDETFDQTSKKRTNYEFPDFIIVSLKNCLNISYQIDFMFQKLLIL